MIPESYLFEAFAAGIAAGVVLLGFAAVGGVLFRGVNIAAEGPVWERDD